MGSDPYSRDARVDSTNTLNESSAQLKDVNTSVSTSSSSLNTTVMPNESTNLLPKVDETRSNYSDQNSSYHYQYYSANMNTSIPSLNQLLTETYILVELALPITLTYLLQLAIPLASIYCLGHLGPTELAASALSTMFANVTGWSVAMGMATALDTLCPQSFASNEPKYKVGVYLQRGILISMLLMIPVSILWLYAEPILLYIGQPALLSEYCGRYLKLLLLGAPPYVVFECIKKYLQAQSIMSASTYCLLATIPINLLLNYILIFHKSTSLGFDGAAITVSITNWILMVFGILYIKYVDGSACWNGWSHESFMEWIPFLKLGLPGIIMICSEWWAFEIMALASSYFGTTSLAAHSINQSICNLTYMVPLSLSIASSTRMGNLIGKNSPHLARLSAFASILIATLASFNNSAILYLFRDFWANLFTDDSDVANLTSQLLPLAALFQLVDGLSGVCGGILRGQGRQKLGAIANVFCYYFISLPVGLVLAFYFKYEVFGLWYGLSLALLLCAITLVTAVLSTNWPQLIVECRNRLRIEQQSDL